MGLDPSSPTLLFFGAIALLGLIAGMVGGVSGLGGSIVTLPGLAILLGFADESHREQHVYMGAAMLCNLAVAVPAAWRHARAGVLNHRTAARLLPSIVVGVVAGVLFSNRLDGVLLTRLLGGMILFFVVLVYVRERLSSGHEAERTSGLGMDVSGLSTGLSAGLLGVGGGVVLVTALRVLARVRIRTAIGLSAAVMIVTAGVGATLKVSMLGNMGLNPFDAVRIALALAPGAVVGSLIGASLVHSLPVERVRVVVSVIMVAAAVKLLVS